MLGGGCFRYGPVIKCGWKTDGPGWAVGIKRHGTEEGKAMLDITRLSSRYAVRFMQDSDAEEILDFCRQNTQYYRYCGKQPSKELVLQDLRVTPPGIERSAKYYVGFYDHAVLVAIMDLIDGYPGRDWGYIGFFMVNKQLQGNQVGSGILREVCQYLKTSGITTVRLGIDKDNPQSNHFWKKNGFAVIREVEQDGGTILVAEKTL